MSSFATTTDSNKHTYSDYESEGRRFESCRARHGNTVICRVEVKWRKWVGLIPSPFDRVIL